MLPKDLLQSMKDDLERKSPEDVADVSVTIQSSEMLAKAEVAKFIEGKWVLFDVFVVRKGTSDDIQIGA